MNKTYFLLFALVCANQAIAKDFDYRNVAMAGTGSVGDLFIRYLLPLNESCLLIQNLVPGKLGEVSAQKEICSLDGKKIDSDFAAVDLKEGVFKGGRLFFEIGVTPFEPVGETIMSCEVIFSHELADHLFCKKKENSKEDWRTCSS